MQFIKISTYYLISIIFILSLFKIATFAIIDKNSTLGTHYSFLASGFLKRQINLPVSADQALKDDLIVYNNKVFSPHAFFPAILLIPIVAIFDHTYLSQTILNILANIIIFFLLLGILKFYKIEKKFVIPLIIWFFFGSHYLFSAFRTSSYGLQHIVGILFILAAILAVLKKFSPFSIGALFTAGFLSRYPLFSFIFLFIYLIFKNQNRLNLKNLIYFLLPVIFGIFIILLYNYQRFLNPFQTGYTLSNSNYPDIFTYMPYGLQSLKYVSKNLIGLLFFPPILYYLNFQSYLNFEWSEYFRSIEAYPGLIFTGLTYFYALYLSIKHKKQTFVYWSTVLLILLIILTHFRLEQHYFTDAMPAILLILIIFIKEKIFSEKAFTSLLFISILLNTYWYSLHLFQYG